MAASWSRWAALALVCAGCARTWTSDPNQRAGGLVDGDVLARNLAAVVTDLDERVARGEATPEVREQRLKEYLDRTLKGVDPGKVPAVWAWQYGDAYRLKGEWEEAGRLYERSLAAAKDEDRRVNDSLRLARVRAHQGRHDEAIKLVRATFDAPPPDKGAILMAVVYEIVPEGRGTGPKKEYAKLLAEAVRQHEATVVAVGTSSGAAFLEARPAHVRRAYLMAAELALAAGDRDLARQYLGRSEEAASRSAKL